MRKNKVDMHAITHRKAKDCTCYDCTKEETRNYLNLLNNKNVLEQGQNGQNENQSETGRLS